MKIEGKGLLEPNKVCSEALHVCSRVLNSRLAIVVA